MNTRLIPIYPENLATFEKSRVRKRSDSKMKSDKVRYIWRSDKKSDKVRYF